MRQETTAATTHAPPVYDGMRLGRLPGHLKPIRISRFLSTSPLPTMWASPLASFGSKGVSSILARASASLSERRSCRKRR
jgi:hypothetical protein